MPPFHPNATVPVPAPTLPSATAPPDADSSARRTASAVTGRARMSFSVPSFVSATSGLIDRTRSIPGCASIHSTIASAAFQTQSVQVSRIGVSISPSSFDLRAARELAEAVADEHRRGHALEVGVARVREDRRDSGADLVAFVERHLSDAHAGDVGDGVERARA